MQKLINLNVKQFGQIILINEPSRYIYKFFLIKVKKILSELLKRLFISFTNKFKFNSK